MVFMLCVFGFDGKNSVLNGKMPLAVDIRLSAAGYSFVIMDSLQLISRRLESQGFSGRRFVDAAAMVRWMGCMQSQDFAMAKWAIGVRFNGLSDAVIEADLNSGRILRTHVLRPTWHFVLPADIGWMLKMSAARIRAFTQPW